MSEYLIITTVNREHDERIHRARQDAMVRELRRARRDRGETGDRAGPNRPAGLLARLGRRAHRLRHA